MLIHVKQMNEIVERACDTYPAINISLKLSSRVYIAFLHFESPDRNSPIEINNLFI